MTNEEALKHYRHAIEQAKAAKDEKFMLILTIGAEALEKQVPKKLGKADFGNHKNFFDKCPNCGYEAAGSHFKYCHECGQRLDWGD